MEYKAWLGLNKAGKASTLAQPSQLAIPVSEGTVEIRGRPVAAHTSPFIRKALKISQARILESNGLHSNSSVRLYGHLFELLKYRI